MGDLTGGESGVEARCSSLLPRLSIGLRQTRRAGAGAIGWSRMSCSSVWFAPTRCSLQARRAPSQHQIAVDQHRRHPGRLRDLPHAHPS
jgi:hypothetical protein